MKFSVFELPRAIADKRHIFEWIYERSPSGAGAWLDAYDVMVARLKEHADGFSEALENADCRIDVKQAMFKTRYGRVYRALFTIEDGRVYILRVRGPGQAPVDPGEFSALK